MALWLNLPRVRLQHTWAVMEGIMAGTSNEDLPPAWAEAVARHPAEAEEILIAANVPRADARVKTKLNWYG